MNSRDELIKQISFLAYHFHWQQQEILSLPHTARRRYCSEINKMNRQRNGETGNLFEV